MIVKTRKRFFQDLENIRSLDVFDEIEAAFDAAHQAESLSEIPGFKRLVHHPNWGRIRVEGYRIGVEINGDTEIFCCVLPRDVVYSQFP
jgi:mRNA-degrading endonuclease RelE of RelBE toxin-antitoxin system